MDPVLFGVCRRLPITFTSPSSKAHQKSGSFPPPALPSFIGRMTLSDSRRCRHLKATLRPLLSHPTDVPRPLPRRIERVLMSIASPLMLPSPNGRRVGIRIVTFEACSGFTHVTAHRIAQPPKGDLCHEAPTHAVACTSRSSATGSIDNSPCGIFLH